MKHLLCLLLFITAHRLAPAQVAVTPGKDDTVNFTHVLFELPYHKNAKSYQVDIYRPEETTRPLKASSRDNSVLITSGLAFNTAWLWTYSYYDKKGKPIFTSPPYNLYIYGNWYGDTALFRNTVEINQSGKYDDGYIALDHGLIINRSGHVVWTFPPGKFGTVRALNITKDGTLTFLRDNFAIETDLRANIIWKSPDSIPGYKLPDYHHEFRKLDNGNYLCVARRIKAGEKDNIPYSVVFEIDRNNTVKWVWDEKGHYKHDKNFHGTHMNAAYYDEKTRKLYLSHRDLSSIARVDVATGQVDYSIGYDYGNNIPYYPNPGFAFQHAVCLDAKGNLLFFNNNDRNKAKRSSVMCIAQPKGRRPPEVSWEYPFNFEDEGYNFASKLGGVSPMPNGNVLVCLGANNRIVEVTEKKEIVWQADAEKYDSTAAKFAPVASGYRAGFASTLYLQQGRGKK